jgi:hypothetical protein
MIHMNHIQIQMNYSWKTPPLSSGFCVIGPDFPTRKLADLHAKASVEKYTKKKASEYTITAAHANQLFQFITYRIFITDTDAPSEGDIALSIENQQVYAYIDNTKAGFLNAAESAFYMEMNQYQSYDMYAIEHKDQHIDIVVEYNKYAFEFSVVGMRYNGNHIFSDDDDISLEPEDGNQYDQFAVKVIVNNTKVGYVCRRHAREIRDTPNFRKKKVSFIKQDKLSATLSL